MEKLKEVLLGSTFSFIFLILIEKNLPFPSSQLETLLLKSWFFLPFVFVVLLLLLDEARKKKLLTRIWKIKPFFLPSDSIVMSIFSGLILYFISVKLHFAKGTLIRPFFILEILVLCYLFCMMVRWIISVFYQKKESNLDNDKLFLDQPIFTEKEDKLGRTGFSQRIAEVIGTRRNTEGLVIGLFGEWGSGKSSILNLTKNFLKNEIVFEFNPWFFESEKELIKQFFIQFGNAVRRKDVQNSRQLAKLLKLYGENVASLKMNIGLISLSVKQFQSIFQQTTMLENMNMIELRDSIIELLNQNGRRITVFIDDIDRLNRKEIQTVFKLVKLIADFPYTAYILAFDDRMVANVLAEMYDGSVHQRNGESFLEKIIQVPLHMPTADPIYLRNMIFSGIGQILTDNAVKIRQEQSVRFASIWDSTIGGFVSTPRMVKRYLNTLLFSIPLLKGEVNTFDQILIEALRVFYPDVYNFVRLNPEIVLKSGNILTSQKFSDILQLFSKEEGESLQTLLKELFPMILFKENNFFDSSSDREWAGEKRICSREYFDRYFKYAVPAGDVPDVWFENLFTLMEKGTLEDVISEIDNTIKQRGLPRFIQKLRQKESTISPSAAKMLAEILAVSGRAFPREEQQVFGQTWIQAAILITNLIKRIPKIERVDFSKHLAEVAETLSFAMQIFTWLSNELEEKIDPNYKVYTQVEIAEIAEVLIKRIKQESEGIEFLDKYSTNNDVPELLWIWKKWGNPEEVEIRITEWITEENGVERFLLTFLTKGYDVQTGIGHIIPFMEIHYKNLKDLISPEILYDHLKRKYNLKNFEENIINKYNLYEKVALEFMSIHRNKKQTIME